MVNVFELRDLKTVSDIVHEYPSPIKHGQVPLVIDNGSYQCRVGWAISEKPLLTFKNLIAKPRKERVKKDGEPPVTPPIQIGNDILNIEAVRFQLKTQFDRNVVTHFEAQEQVFDYTFAHLGIDSEGSVQHPIVMTEAFLNPNYCRQLMSELLFECYGVPMVAYGVDSLYSFYRNDIGDTGLIVNCGYHTIHIIPVIRGEVVVEQSRRINLGGSQMISYLHKLLQLKYPVHVNAITASRAEELLQEHCEFALHYQEEIRRWTEPQYYEDHVRRIQLPYTLPAPNATLSAEAQKERKKEMARRLMDINARKREEKLAEDQEQLNQLLAIQDYLDDGDGVEFNRALQSFEIKDYEDLKRQISALEARIERTRARTVAAAAAAAGGAGGEAREADTASAAPKDPQALAAWLQDLREKHAALVGRRAARRARRADAARRRTAAAAERMRLISQLAAPARAPRDDDFGARDDDWDIYKTISRDAESESETESERLVELEEALREHDAAFLAACPADTHQLHVGLERLRAPELMFQPSMVGNIEAGLAETLEYVFKHFSPSDQLLLANNVFLTGGTAKFPGLKERLERELLEMRPFKSTHKVVMAQNPNLDAWHGARDFATSPSLEDWSISRAEYCEMGGEYLKEHYSGNRYYPSPAALLDTLAPSGDANVVKEEVVIDC